MKRALLVIAGLALAAVFYWASERTAQRPASAPESPPPAPAQQAPAPGNGAPASPGDGKWSATRPAVNQEHLFEGEVNRRGKPVGFHSRPGGVNPSRARVVRIVQGPNRAGVYVADVEIRNESGRWLKKRSTFYPDRMSREQVVAAVLRAWSQHQKGRDNPFRGPSGQGFTIEGWPLDGDINTAYPIFDGRE